MTAPLRIAINGASGRMGKELLACLQADARFELVHAVVSAGSVHDGQALSGTSLRYAHDWQDVPAPDVVVDFSGPAGLSAVLDYCLPRGVALVTGTTGFDAALEARLVDAATRMPLLRAANFSLGIAVLTRLLREAAAALRDWDLEIIEAHHGRKEDAPSGTALALGHAAAAARGSGLARDAVYSREGRTGPRREGSIGFAVVRGGDIVGEHQALLIGHGERVELGHRATDRSIFARGALEAAHWVAGKAAGHYDLDAMLAERSGR
ncbi:4-hydroxy-tetrahydrodipicolinate reductase [Dyella sp. A6]|uniref:4-hydroxy-tetrahydrodipicolinate reductase n=1 Tax=Dyella aluminiiresistens TaxID=3069105 RepID=UPI002E7769FC|nr:4-hydroxy-tetrahydrodipicolinate reductase [Dyella sp. A6]